MKIEEIILKYQEKGVRFQVKDGKLGFTGPKGVIDVEARKEVQEYKEDIISYLEKHKDSVIVDKDNKFKEFRLTDIQSAYLVGRNESYTYGGIGCKIYSEFEFPHLEVSRLNEAWIRVVENNDMLHAVIKHNGVQQILEEYTVPKIKEWDMRDASEEETKKHLQSVRKRLTEKQYSIDECPLYDLEITSLKDDLTILHLSLDMLVADFTSINIIIDELEKSYFEGSLPSKELSYRDVIVYQDNEKKYPKYLEKQLRDEQYWKERISSMSEAPELPKEEVEGKISIRQFNNYINKDRCEVLQSFADKNNVTLSGVILALYAETLAYWSTEKDFSINITMANRPDIHSEIKKVIGDFTVVDILEVKTKENKKFSERLQNIQKQLWSDLEHLSYTGVEVLREMTRQKKKEVIIPYVYTSTLGLVKEEDNKESRGKLLYKISQTPQVLIDCQVMEYKDGILVNWDVRENIFPMGMIEDAFESFVNLLNEADIEGLQCKNSIIELPKETREVRKRVNSTEEEFLNQTLHKGFCENVNLYPNKEALFSDGRSFTYREVGDYAMAIKNKLMNCKIKDSDIVAIELNKGIWQLAAVLGTLLAGGTYLPIDMDYPRSRKDKIETNSKAKFIITSNKNEINIEGAEVINVEELQVLKNQQVKSEKVDSNKPAYIIYTSGSTGEPKGVVISHKAAMNTIQDMVKRFNITRDDRVLGIANLAFDLSVFDIFGMLFVGGSIVFPEGDKDIAEWNRLIKEKEITITNTVPAQMQMLSSYLEAEKEEGLEKVRLMLLSGDWIPVSLPKKLYNLFSNVKLVSLGGATEASIWSIAYEIDKDESFERSVPYGTPLSNQEFYVLDDNMSECPNYVKGKLFIAGMGLADEYLGDRDLTEKKFVFSEGLGKRLYDTGDCGRYLSSGVIEFIGRVDNQVKIRGHRVELSEIESVINSYDDVEESVVVLAEKNEDMMRAYVQPCIEEVKEDEVVLSKLEERSKYFNSSEDFFSATVDDFEEWLRNSNYTALLDILKTFRSVGVFADKDKWYSLDEIYNLVEVHPYYQPLIRRWIRALKTEGYVELSAEDIKFRLNADIKIGDADKSWESWIEVDKRVNYSDLMMNFFKDTRENLLPLLRGKLDPIDLFFPKGDFKVALAAYKDNIVSRCTNDVVVDNIEIFVKEFNKKNPGKKFRLLEVGAGVGGVSIDLIDRLKDYSVEYIYTDISHSFLNEAQKRFAEYPWIKYGLYDINEDYWDQNLTASSLDLILCNNVLHNANDALRVLKQFREMSVPNGNLVIIDATGNNYALMTSIEFLNGLNGVEDFRAEDEQIFLRKGQWIDVLGKAGINVMSMFPERDNPLEVLGQTVFVAKFASERKRIESKDVEEYLKNNLPDYMLPNSIEVIENMPLTNNGKVDRKALQKRLSGENPFIQSEGEEPETDLEKAVAEIWKECLKRESIWRNENFYDAGGDSLLVAQVVAKMKEEILEAEGWEWDELMVALIEAPTIKGLCEKLLERERGNEESTDKDSCIITLKADEDSDIAKVLVHDGTGTISPYNYVISYMNKCEGRALLALRCNDMDEYLSIEPNKLIQTLGERYANQLINTGKTEFELVGYCMGGLIALEIAKVLEESGMKVNSLINIDTTPSRRMLDNELLMERGFGMIIGADVKAVGHTVDDELLKKAISELSKKHKGYISNEDLLKLDGEFKPISECYAKLIKKTHEERLEDLYATLSDKDGEVLGYNKERLDILYKVFCHSFRAVISYDAGIYMGDAKVLSCKDKNTDFLPVEPTDNEEFWRSAVMGNVEIVPIEGKHLTCLLPSYAKDIAGILMMED